MRSRGFSLIEIMIALAIGSLVMVGTMTILNTFFRGQQRIDTKLQVQDLDGRIRNILGDETTCLANFLALLDGPSKEFEPTESGVASFNSDPIKTAVKVKLGDGAIVQAGFPGGNFTVDAYRLRLLFDPASALGLGGTGTYEAELKMVTGTRGRTLAGGNLKARVIPITIRTAPVAGSPNRLMTSCIGKGSSLNGTCLQGQMMTGLDAVTNKILCEPAKPCNALGQSIIWTVKTDETGAPLFASDGVTPIDGWGCTPIGVTLCDGECP